jgi:hypothetical protein
MQDPGSATSNEIEVVLKTLRQADEPLTVAKLSEKLPPGSYKLSQSRLEFLLEEQVSLQRVHRFEPYRGKSPRYWTNDVEHYARESTMNLLRERGPLTLGRLWEALKSRLKDYSKSRQQHLVKKLVQEKQISEWPPSLGGRTKLFDARPPDPRYYLDDAISKISKKLGLPREEVTEATREIWSQGQPAAPIPALSKVDLGQLILQRMVRIEPAAAAGALVLLCDLWKSMKQDVPDKASFDRSVLHLAEQGRVALHHHDFPSSLTQHERDEMVLDGRIYYVGISLRM